MMYMKCSRNGVAIMIAQKPASRDGHDWYAIWV
jgi:hypothetical protein